MAQYFDQMVAGRRGEDSPVRRAQLSPTEELSIWQNYDYRGRARIIEAYQPLVFYIYGKLGVYLGEEAVDVISEGTVGLIQAVDNFDYRRGVTSSPAWPARARTA
jgi:DNA-directed RNA polymerase specialized sigma subunit